MFRKVRNKVRIIVSSSVSGDFAFTPSPGHFEAGGVRGKGRSQNGADLGISALAPA